MNEQELRLRIGFGSLFAIAFIAVVHALTVSVAFQNPKMRDFEIVDLPPLLNPTSSVDAEPTFYSASQAQDLPKVNLQAQTELKKDLKPYQPPNQASKQQIGQIGPMQDCPNCPQPAPAPYYPAPRPPNNPAPTPAYPSGTAQVKDYQLLLFIGTDAQSRELLNWFNQHPKFQFLRSKDSKVAVQIYSAGDQMYRLRYASVVPVSEFPAVVLADREGGHIHAASRQFIPRGDPDKLYEDLKLGTQLYLQAKQQRPAQARTSGAMTSARQYNWDDRISPDMRWQQAEAPPVEEGFRPFDRPGSGGGGLFDQCGPDGCKPKSALVWTDASEIMIVGLVIVGIIAAVKLLGNLRK